ncbi:MAG: histidine kinase, partial [Candidatus Cloacimonadota bacterium]
IQQRLFTPFFSTKTGGQGLGLTLIREILLNHGFKFSLYTRDDGFTVFVIEF